MATDPARVAVVGSYNQGLTVSAPSIPVPGETVMGDDYTEVPGGKGSNQAVAAARLGAETAFVGRVGDDRFADDAFALWNRESVDARVERVPGEHTGVGTVVVDDHGENAIVVAPGANAHLDADAVHDAADAVADADVLLTQLEIQDEPVAAAVDVAADADTQIVLNPAPARDLPADLLADVDVLTPNRTEAHALAGHPPDADRDDAALAHDLLATGPDAVVLTLGSDGALVATDDHETRIPPTTIDPVDTTGAGDAFNAALAVARGHDRDLADATRFASRAGALACTSHGVIDALPHRDAVEQL